MQERISRLDDTLIDRVCQPIIDRLGDKMTIDCFRVARILNDGAALAWILSQAGGVASAFATGNGALAGAQGALLLIGLAALSTLRRVFDGKQAPRSPSSARGNPLRPAMFVHRLCCLLGLGVQVLSAPTRPAGVAGLLIVAVSLLVAASVYVGACSSPPPVPRRRTAWDGLRRAALT